MKKKRNNSSDYLSIFLKDIPLVDTRAPVEFSKGSFPSAVNLPLLDDEQRAIIGTRYKKQGNDAAVALGLQMATPKVKAQRLAAWQAFVQQHPEGYLFCFRGGQRSHTTQQWLAESGYPYPLINGGYKAMRTFLLEQLEQSIAEIPLIVLGGKTGTGKTQLIRQLPFCVDLEGLANHRGSSFGRCYGGQPPQIAFENALSIALLKHRHFYPNQPLLLEDESRLIGRCSLPEALHHKMDSASRILLEESVEARIEVVLQEYVHDNLAALVAAYGEEEGFKQYTVGFELSLYRIRRRLGGERYQQVLGMLHEALALHQHSGDVFGYRPIIERLLVDYYDPMYDYQLSSKLETVLYQGDKAAVFDFYTTHIAHSAAQ